ncbi:MAG: SpoVG family protein [Clostridiales bacterium]|jgi:stage V sporulation protein G|nr:SpoVG family protein [Clostridiales bacterium]
MGKVTIFARNSETDDLRPLSLEIRAYPVAEPKGSVAAFASVAIEGAFGVHGISVVNGKNGLFVSMPQSKDKNGEYHDVFHPVTSEGRKALNEAVLSEYAAARESLADKLREGAKAAAERPSPERTAKRKDEAEL